MLDDAANVIQGEFGQARVAVAGEQVLTVFPDGLVHVHARTVVANDGFGHAGGRLAIYMRYVVYGVFTNLIPVGALDQGADHGTDFKLALSGPFVVVDFARKN